MTDLHAGMILAAIQLTVMFGAMRAFYGAWPWEHRKTWYATKPNPIYAQLHKDLEEVVEAGEKWIEASRPAPTLTVDIPKPFGVVAGTDSFDRDKVIAEIPREQIEDAARNP